MNNLYSLALCAFISWGMASYAEAETERPPNVILLFTDDHGYADLGSHGSKLVKTPNIDALAVSGIRFKGGYVTAPQCCPSRAGMMSGQYQQKFAMENNAASLKEFGLPVNIRLFPQYMKEAGYVNAALGKWHLGDYQEEFFPGNRGFDWTWGMPGSPTELNGEEWRRQHKKPDSTHNTKKLTVGALDFMEKNRDKPFFMYMAYHVPHAPYISVPKWMDQNMHVENEDKRVLAGMISELDDSVGQIVSKVRKLGLEEDTLIFFISDNGAQLSEKYPQTVGSNLPLKGKKGTLYGGGVRVPWIASWKGVIPPGQVSDEPVISLDVLPTALAAAGRADLIADELDGVDILPFMTGKADWPKRPLFFRWAGWMAIRHGNWKMVYPREGRRLKLPFDPAKLELYDMSGGIVEAENVADQYPEVVQRLQKELFEWSDTLTAPGWVDDAELEALKAIYGDAGMKTYVAPGFKGRQSDDSKKKGAPTKTNEPKKGNRAERR